MQLVTYFVTQTFETHTDIRQVPNIQLLHQKLRGSSYYLFSNFHRFFFLYMPLLGCKNVLFLWKSPFKITRKLNTSKTHTNRLQFSKTEMGPSTLEKCYPQFTQYERQN